MIVLKKVFKKRCVCWLGIGIIKLFVGNSFVVGCLK